MDVLTKEQRHKNMSNIKSKNGKSEIRLRKALWHIGIRYRKNDKFLPGKPDIVITKYKIAIFVDGDFWHGRDMKVLKKRLDVHRDFWISKIERNKERDEEVNEQLTEMGWLILRFWDSDIKKDISQCIRQIMRYIPQR